MRCTLPCIPTHTINSSTSPSLPLPPKISASHILPSLSLSTGSEATTLNVDSKHQRRFFSIFSSISVTQDHRNIFMGFMGLHSPLLAIWQYSALQVAKQNKSAEDRWELNVFSLEGIIFFSFQPLHTSRKRKEMLLNICKLFWTCSDSEWYGRQMQSLASKHNWRFKLNCYNN